MIDMDRSGYIERDEFMHVVRMRAQLHPTGQQWSQEEHDVVFDALCSTTTDKTIHQDQFIDTLLDTQKDDQEFSNVVEELMDAAKAVRAKRQQQSAQETSAEKSAAAEDGIPTDATSSVVTPEGPADGSARAEASAAITNEANKNHLEEIQAARDELRDAKLEGASPQSRPSLQLDAKLGGESPSLQLDVNLGGEAAPKEEASDQGLNMLASPRLRSLSASAAGAGGPPPRHPRSRSPVRSPLRARGQSVTTPRSSGARSEMSATLPSTSQDPDSPSGMVNSEAGRERSPSKPRNPYLG